MRIDAGETYFRGKKFPNKFESHDHKEFCPNKHQNLRKDLFKAAIYSREGYFKGCPGKHNMMSEDLDLMARLNGSFSDNLTFSDLLVNENFYKTKTMLLNIGNFCYSEVVVVGNFRCEKSDFAKNSTFLPIPDHVFSNYIGIKQQLMQKILNLPKGALVLSSASSLSNVIGQQLWEHRQDVTFIDIGSAINNLLGLNFARAYAEKKSLKELFSIKRALLTKKMSFE